MAEVPRPDLGRLLPAEGCCFEWYGSPQCQQFNTCIRYAQEQTKTGNLNWPPWGNPSQRRLTGSAF